MYLLESYLVLINFVLSLEVIYPLHYYLVLCREDYSSILKYLVIFPTLRSSGTYCNNSLGAGSSNDSMHYSYSAILSNVLFTQSLALNNRIVLFLGYIKMIMILFPFSCLESCLQSTIILIVATSKLSVK